MSLPPKRAYTDHFLAAVKKKKILQKTVALLSYG